jgi:tetratricopeptide (TPR) repeat protein
VKVNNNPRVPKSASLAVPGKPGGMLRALTGRGVAGASLDLDINANPQMASQQYQDFVAAFDAQREGAAHAIFGLGEAYRKLGRLDEARAQYGRILREFVDFPELAQQSQKLLSQNPPNKWKLATEAGSSANRQALAEERELLMEELSLLENELATIKARISQGLEPSSNAVPVQREILQLRQRLVRLRADDKPENSLRSR